MFRITCLFMAFTFSLSPLFSSGIEVFVNGRILRNHKIEKGELWVSGGKVIPPQAKADLIIDLEGKIIAPGFIDMQINGGFGCDFSRNPEKIPIVAKNLLSFGVTSFLPTVISSYPEEYRTLLPHLQPRSFREEGAEVLGIHLEGPFFAPQYAGAHNPKAIVSSFETPIEEVYGNLEGVKIITLAPELPYAIPLIQKLSQQGILISAGHSAAGFEEMQQAVLAGVGLVTHLFNAMKPYHHRNPAIIGSALIRPSLPYSLIVDGVHLCPETVALAFHCNPNGLILISDATEALGLPDGTYQLGTQTTELRKGQIFLSGTNTLAGSNLNLHQAVRNLISFTGCSIEFALEAASLKPA
jgi:N-acetylglucosamine-6-phosphate deacetylase